ncbi:acyl-CoA dehydrogenase [Streptomyces agglomeratus]|uniref:Acyl-CoA dehydrogenase n=1 Tax=Streptomyces agglomeratus TaxID=285458 RepID=A0A1E5PA05_9ACTN|nr:acyl-CoA dehydrogenase family protein [Streptomyces agglomeratus]OEJ26382.1 acyl-CoA dehydrogenase [Streptomyces agglomeratus]OEJ52119.1 acyl-CoA dehydrogenase [Streptomyces agglomeratus]
MDFRLTDDQRALRAGVRELLEGRFGRERLRAAVDKPAPGADPALDRALWRELGDAGFFALRLPEKDGGVGLGLPEAVLAFEEAGRALVPGPLVATHLAAGSVPGAATGETVVTRVDGELVEWLDAADCVLGGTGITAGAVPVRSVDPLTPLHRVPGGAGASGEPPEPGAALGALLTAAEQLGSAARTTEAAVHHACEREQFGRPVGAFQAVKQLCAHMLVRTEVARGAVYGAAVTGDPVEIAGAKLLADEAAVRNARDCLQVHGGTGFTWEADVHLHLKRAWVRAERWPTAGDASETLAAALL